MGKRAVVVLGAAIITLSACTGSARATKTDKSPTSTGPARSAPRTATITTTAPPPEFSFDNSVPPPKLVNTGTDYVAILKSLGSYGNWLAAHRPEPERASTIIAPGSKLRDVFARDLTHLRDNGTRLIEQVSGPSIYTVLSHTPDAFSAKVVENIVLHKTVIESGRVTSEFRYTGVTTYLMLVVLVEGHWRFAAVDAQQPTNVHL